ncbi:MAG TPA: hypothetical protein PLB49_04795 [Chitinophagaceae bacterium]|nr:hypothetical protein [Chitinophagaceae bacterium]HPH31141.1 hypothetical protein [Chitinophagaceae bacterium]
MSNISSIISNGGWCQLHQPCNFSFANNVGGRLIYFNDELALLEKYDNNFSSLDGYYVILKKEIQNLVFANWIKRMLTTGGKEVPAIDLPLSLKAENLNEFLSNLKSSKELFILKLNEKALVSRIVDFSNTGLVLDVLSDNGVSEKKNFLFADIVCFELRVQGLKQIVRNVRRTP